MSARILGLDVSTCTGYGFWISDRDVSSIDAGVIELPAAKTYFDPRTKEEKHDYSWDDWRVAQVGPKILKLLQRTKPEFVLIEERLRFSKTGDNSFAMTQAIHGAILSHCCTMGIAFGTIYSQSWRSAAYPDGFKQPLLPALDRNGKQKVNKETGKLEFKKKDWGDIAVEKCEELGVQLPPQKSIAHNAAEAALIAMVWRCKNRISIPASRDQAKYKALLERSPRAARPEPMGAAA
ncbi:hypothetical protein B5M44_21895 [Shinella sumterensis]|uniref:hypothetical protein n=1 Tax=Shinella sumterensis TaxID=1967501 RepID=UPI00106E3B1B|nr:hypothetical protein [Shinella sumterensis]MCD1266929.1 hypothetical protein [Shinella sumterensis]TFE95191.1 hypothetical protein B5M44_21895 [Shinella sumterensis]